MPLYANAAGMCKPGLLVVEGTYTHTDTELPHADVS